MPIDAQRAARKAGLNYVDRTDPGFTRKRRGKTFHYFDVKGRPITQAAEIERINSLAIPPAYKDVWICADPRGHLQAVGMDDRGRLQYRYHPDFRLAAEQAKFHQLASFGRQLPKIRSTVRSRLRGSEPTKDRVLAAALRLLERAYLRVGNAEYARDNASFGLTTLRRNHVKIEGNRVTLRFIAKGGIERHVEMEDAPLARLLEQCIALKGKELLCWKNDAGQVVDLSSADVNEAIQQLAEDATAKDFRTWHATVTAAVELEKAGLCATKHETKRRITAAAKATAEKLGHTPAVCRKSYIHPQIMACYEVGTLCDLLAKGRRRQSPAGLTQDERAVLSVLEQV